MCGAADRRVSARIGQVPALAGHLLVPLDPAVRVGCTAQSVSKLIRRRILSTSTLHIFGVLTGELGTMKAWLLKGLRVTGDGVAASGVVRRGIPGAGTERQYLTSCRRRCAFLCLPLIRPSTHAARRRYS